MTSYWQLQPIFGSYVLTGALATLLVLLLLVNPSFGQLPPQRQRWLRLIRAVIAILLLVAMLRPTWIMTETRIQTAKILLLFDTSRSMTHRDGDDGKSRWDQQTSFLRSALPTLQGMGDRFEVDLIGYDGGISPQERKGDELSIQARPDGDETDIGGAILESLQRSTGKRIAAVILAGDGAQRALAPKTPPQQAARQLDRLATPLYTVAVGRSRDQSQSRDVAIENLQDEYNVFVKNEFALQVGVRIQGYVQQPIEVSVTVEDEAGELTPLAAQSLVATESSQVVMGNFSFRPEKAGQYKLRVKAAPQAGESIENNEMTAFLNVRDGGLRVLLLAGGLGAEQKFLRRSLDESHDIELDYQRVNIRTRNRWPLNLQQQVDLAQYDVYVIGDVDSRAYRAEDWQRLAQLVDEGRGLMMYGGFHSFGPGGYSETALAAVLPIEMDRFEREIDPVSAKRVDRHVQGELVMLPVAANQSPITHLAPEGDNVGQWRTLAPLQGANRFDRLKDRSVVLARSNKGDPLLVQGEYVAGRVLALATDSTYRWFRYGKPEVHRKFWRQAILWLARRDGLQADSVFIELPQRRFQARSRVPFRTGFTDSSGDTVLDANLRATLTRPDGSTANLPLSSGSGGDAASQGVIVDTEEAGDYRLLVEALDEQQVMKSSFLDFVVEKKDFELSDPAANPGLLDMLARMTERVGGRAIAPEQLPAILEELEANAQSDKVETQSRWQLGDTPVDAWAYFLALVGLLAVEWFLRKRWGLV